MKRILIVILLFIVNLCFSQGTDNKDLQNFIRINLGLHGLDISYEWAPSNNFVWENGLGIGMGNSIYGSSVEYYFNLARPTPYLKSELKYIYNTQKQISKGKSILNNSGNYIGFQTKYSFGNDKDYKLNQSLLTELHWGIQRRLGERFVFNTHIGLGYIKDFDTNHGSITPTIGLRVSYKLF